MNLYHDLSTSARVSFDLASLGVLFGTIFAHLPGIAALFTIVWTTIRILETRTVRSLLGRPPSEGYDGD